MQIFVQCRKESGSLKLMFGYMMLIYMYVCVQCCRFLVRSLELVSLFFFTCYARYMFVFKF